jgi:hypothetical protein
MNGFKYISNLNMKIIKKYLLQIVWDNFVELFYPSFYPIIEVLFAHTFVLVLFISHHKFRNYCALKQLFSDIVCKELFEIL